MDEGKMRVPPYSMEAEQNILGAILLNEDCLVHAMSEIEPSWFYHNSFRTIFTACQSLSASGSNVDVITLMDELKSVGALDTIGGVATLAELTSSVAGSVSMMKGHIKIIKNKFISREVIKTASDAVQRCYDGENVEEIVSDISSGIIGLSYSERKNCKTMEEIAKEVLADIEDVYEGKKDPFGLRTGFIDIDKRIYGLNPAELVLISGRPAMGKTTFAMNIAMNVAKNGNNVLIFSMEMRSNTLGRNLLSSSSGVNKHSIRMGHLNDTTWPKIIHSIESLSKLPIAIDDSSALEINKIRSLAKMQHMKKKLDLIVVDYLGLATAKGESKTVVTSEISAGLKAMAKDLDIPVISLVQLNRGVEQRTDKRPMLSDLKDSGSIEQDADVSMMLYRDDYYNPDTHLKGVTEVIINKVRDGEPGTDMLIFDGKTASFKNKAEE